MSRQEIPEKDRKDFYLYVDEFQNFATDSFANILSEARKYRLNLIIAHQYTAQLSNENGTAVRDAVFGNVGTMIIFRVGADDAEFIEKEFEPEFTAQDLVNLPNFHVYLKLMIDGVTSRPFSASTLPPLKFDVAEGVREKIVESSRRLYTRPRAEVEAEISKWSGMLQVGEGEAKYKADCSNCGKVTMVPFEPKEGRPVYCKDCMFKIKSGELKPQSGFVASRSARQDERVSTAPLAALGIEFTGGGNGDKSFQKPSQNTNFRTNNNRPPERRHSGPSPLLKGLLQKIGVNGGNQPKGQEPEVTEVKSPTPQPVSLSTLKKPTNPSPQVQVPTTPIPVKEASEEKKASLKDLLAKATAHEIKKPEEIPQKEDIIPKPPVIIVTPPTVPPSPAPKVEVKQPEDKSQAWQKPKTDKEVPEDVLRKILE